jgi:hypothetical protein
MVGVVFVVVYRVEVDFGKWRSALAYVQYGSRSAFCATCNIHALLTECEM